MKSKKSLIFYPALLSCFFILVSGVLCNAQPVKKNIPTLRNYAIAKDYSWNQKSVNLPKGKVTLMVDVHRCRLIVFDDDTIFKSYPVAVGKRETPSPIGVWKIQRKAANWGSGFGLRFMGLNVSWGMYGIHGTNKPGSIGSRASHGCIRMSNKDVVELYEFVQVGTPVIITGNPFGALGQREVIHQGHKGAYVVLVQESLGRLGYYEGRCDGVFGYGTERALKALQKEHNLEVTGQVGEKEFLILGL